MIKLFRLLHNATSFCSCRSHSLLAFRKKARFRHFHVGFIFQTWNPDPSFIYSLWISAGNVSAHECGVMVLWNIHSLQPKNTAVKYVWYTWLWISHWSLWQGWYNWFSAVIAVLITVFLTKYKLLYYFFLFLPHFWLQVIKNSGSCVISCKLEDVKLYQFFYLL